MSPHAGERIKEIWAASGMSVSEFARRLNCHRQNVYDIFKRKVVDVELLQRISRVLEHDFVAELYGTKGSKVTLKFSVTVEIAEDGQYKITEVQTVK
ncbi:MAG: helix-turn-helix transcriptional regulator [Bacteroidales bacterium]|nr:helix-turn-helix transcriptional regulator [Bacteroidales bacterium]